MTNGQSLKKFALLPKVCLSACPDPVVAGCWGRAGVTDRPSVRWDVSRARAEHSQMSAGPSSAEASQAVPWTAMIKISDACIVNHFIIFIINFRPLQKEIKNAWNIILSPKSTSAHDINPSDIVPHLAACCLANFYLGNFHEINHCRPSQSQPEIFKSL